MADDESEKSEAALQSILAKSQRSEQDISVKPSTSVKISTKSVKSSAKSSCSKALKKKKPKRRKCLPQLEWDCANTEPWRIYMMSMVDDMRIREEEDMAKYGALNRDRWPNRVCCLQWPKIEDSTRPLCAKLNLFNQFPPDFESDDVTPGPKYDMTKMWKALCTPCTLPEPSKIDYSPLAGRIWPNRWPCSQYDEVRERKIRKRKEKMKKMGALPCEIDDIESPGCSDDERLQELANQKELGHVRIPITYYKKVTPEKVDRDAGEAPGLVNGDTVCLYFLDSKKGNRTYANVCLRGMAGMPVRELDRTREKTWKFCLFQALVALLAKTQLRYKHTWGANIDYIYNHAWLIFLHVGFLNLKENQRFDDVLVYNYKYSVELELIHEIKDVALPCSATFKYVENALKRQRCHRKLEITIEKSAMGNDKTMDCFKRPVNFCTRELEQLFDQLEPRFTNCIVRTSRFCLAFWQDGPFWYTYNPYRCDKYGFWSNDGAACIVKFCSIHSLKRYLVIMMIRAHAFDELDEDFVPWFLNNEKLCTGCQSSTYCQEHLCKRDKCKPDKCKRDRCLPNRCPPYHCGKECPKDKCAPSKCPKEECQRNRKPLCEYCSRRQCWTKGCRKKDKTCGNEYCWPNAKEGFSKDDKITFDVQIYQLIYHKCEIHNVKLYMRQPFQPRPPMVDKKPSDQCIFDPLAHLMPDPCPDSDTEKDEFDDEMEKPSWVTNGKVTWTKPVKVKCPVSREHWHDYEVIVPNRVYVLWGDIHLTDRIFVEENRNRQAFASYVVAAGMAYINSPEYWDSKVINAILVCGDRLYTKRRQRKPVDIKRLVPEQDNWDDRPHDFFRIGETLFEAKILPEVEGNLYHRNERSLWRRLDELFKHHRFLVLICEHAVLGLMNHCGAYYLCDFRSYGPPSFDKGTGFAHVLRLACFPDLVRCAVLIITSPECSSFKLWPVVMGRIVDATDEECGKDRTVCLEKIKPCPVSYEPVCPLEEEIKKAKGIKRRPLEEWKEINAVCCDR